MSRLDSEKINPKVKDILGLLGGGAMLAAFIVIPGLALVAKDVIKIYEEEKRREGETLSNGKGLICGGCAHF